jgi:hypothetical protein
MSTSSLPRPRHAPARRRRHFEGIKELYLRARVDEYLNTTNLPGFYNKVVDDFIELFGYASDTDTDTNDLVWQFSNLSPFGRTFPGLTFTGPGSRPIPLDASQEERDEELDRRRKYRQRLRLVSALNTIVPEQLLTLWECS